MSQALLYLTKSKRVVLALYDFTTGGRYFKAFGQGNTVSSRMSKRLREELGLFVIVLRKPKRNRG